MSILPALAVRDDVAAGRLALLPWAGPVLETAVLMLHHKDKWLSPPLAAFMDLMRRELMDGTAPASPLHLESLATEKHSAGRNSDCCAPDAR